VVHPVALAMRQLGDVHVLVQADAECAAQPIECGFIQALQMLGDGH